MANSIAEDPHPAALDRAGSSAAARLLVARLLPFVPAVALFAAASAFAVNVPFREEWDLVPLLEQIRNGAGWDRLLTTPIMAAKFVAAPLALLTDFDVRALMYAGVALHLLAFLLLWSVLELTLRIWRRRLVAPLSVLLALLMFSTTHHQTWLSGLTALGQGMITLSAAAMVWLLTRWPTRSAAWGLCFVISWIGMMGLPSGVMLWTMVLAAIVTRSLAQRRIPWPQLAAWVIGAVLLGATYWSGFAAMAEHPRFAVLLTHPLRAGAFILTYLGWPLTQTANTWIAPVAGAAGAVLFGLAASAARREPFGTRPVLPWIWLSSYSVMAAALAAASRLEDGGAVALAGTYSASSFLWMGLATAAAVVRWRRRPLGSRRDAWLRRAAIIAAIAWGANYGWLCYEGYIGFAMRKRERTAGLREVYRNSDASNEAFAALYPNTTRARQYAQTLERRRLGPFAGRMSDKRRILEHDRPLAKQIIAADGVLDVASCSVIAGWAWDSDQTDRVVGVEIYDGTILLVTELADRFRRDLLNTGKGDGAHSFSFATPEALKDGRNHTIHARISGTESDLYDSPKTLRCPLTEEISK